MEYTKRVIQWLENGIPRRISADDAKEMARRMRDDLGLAVEVDAYCNSPATHAPGCDCGSL